MPFLNKFVWWGPLPKELSLADSVILPFDPLTWLFIAISLVLLNSLLVVLDVLEGKGKYTLL